MAIPTNIPSGGAGLDNFSYKPEPTSRVEVEEQVLQEPEVESDQDYSEYEEFLRWKQMKKAQQAKSGSSSQRSKSSKATTREKQAIHSQPQETALKPHLVEETTHGSTSGLKQKVDPRTGKTYYEIPKTVMGSDGMPELAVDLDIYDLNGESKNFLGHLQVPPSREEREANRKKRAELEEERRKERERLDQELDEKIGTLDEPEEDPFSEKKKRKLFGRKKSN